MLLKENGSISSGRMGNVPPETAVDTNIVQKTDFYLWSLNGQLVGAVFF